VVLHHKLLERLQALKEMKCQIKMPLIDIVQVSHRLEGSSNLVSQNELKRDSGSPNQSEKSLTKKSKRIHGEPFLRSKILLPSAIQLPEKLELPAECFLEGYCCLKTRPVFTSQNKEEKPKSRAKQKHPDKLFLDQFKISYLHQTNTPKLSTLDASLYSLVCRFLSLEGGSLSQFLMERVRGILREGTSILNSEDHFSQVYEQIDKLSGHVEAQSNGFPLIICRLLIKYASFMTSAKLLEGNIDQLIATFDEAFDVLRVKLITITVDNDENMAEDNPDLKKDVEDIQDMLLGLLSNVLAKVFKFIVSRGLLAEHSSKTLLNKVMSMIMEHLEGILPEPINNQDGKDNDGSASNIEMGEASGNNDIRSQYPKFFQTQDILADLHHGFCLLESQLELDQPSLYLYVLQVTIYHHLLTIEHNHAETEATSRYSAFTFVVIESMLRKILSVNTTGLRSNTRSKDAFTPADKDVLERFFIAYLLLLKAGKTDVSIAIADFSQSEMSKMLFDFDLSGN